MKKIHPIDLFLWTVRRNEKDVIHLYDSLSGIMRVATDGDMLNFGFWDDEAALPILAQEKLCTIFAQMANLEPNQKIVDIGSGFGSPAKLWQDKYNLTQITCVDINFEQLHSKAITANVGDDEKINYVNATARVLPFDDEYVDRVLALESAQHFKPLGDFLLESFRVLKKNGMLVLAIPVVVRPTSIIRLGLLAMTWSSEHYSADFVKSAIKDAGFALVAEKRIGSNIYEPLADYYTKNRESLKPKILEQYPSFVEKILFSSLQKMKSLSENKVIDYLLLVCKK